MCHLVKSRLNAVWRTCCASFVGFPVKVGHSRTVMRALFVSCESLLDHCMSGVGFAVLHHDQAFNWVIDGVDQPANPIWRHGRDPKDWNGRGGTVIVALIVEVGAWRRVCFGDV